MNLDEFIGSVNHDAPPEGVSALLCSLWYAHKGDWERSHDIAQDISSKEGSWVHAYLHREEGDIGNARYWYARAGQPESSLPLAEERIELIRTFLEQS